MIVRAWLESAGEAATTRVLDAQAVAHG